MTYSDGVKDGRMAGAERAGQYVLDEEELLELDDVERDEGPEYVAGFLDGYRAAAEGR